MKSYEERMRDERDEAIADLERQVAEYKIGAEEGRKSQEAYMGLCVQLVAAEEQVAALKVELNNRSAELTGAFHQLAASQLREKELRRLLAEISTLGAATYYDAKDIADEALAFPTDDTALQARLKEEREKCAERIEAVEGEWLTKVAASALIRSMT